MKKLWKVLGLATIVCCLFGGCGLRAVTITRETNLDGMAALLATDTIICPQCQQAGVFSRVWLIDAWRHTDKEPSQYWNTDGAYTRDPGEVGWRLIFCCSRGHRWEQFLRRMNKTLGGSLKEYHGGR